MQSFLFRSRRTFLCFRPSKDTLYPIGYARRPVRCGQSFFGLFPTENTEPTEENECSLNHRDTEAHGEAGQLRAVT